MSKKSNRQPNQQPKKLNTRAAAAKICCEIIDQGRSLDSALADYVEHQQPSPQDKGFTQELVYGVCRWYGELDLVANKYLRSPIRKKDRIVHFLLLVGFYQLRYLNTADHAVLAETVQGCKQLNKVWAKQLVNGCLRNHLRSPAEVADAVSASHPEWLQQELAAAWPNHALAVIHANNQRPPMCLRTNQMIQSRDAYLELLDANNIAAVADPHSVHGVILLKPQAVGDLPGFSDGRCSVQDTAAQLAATILDIQTNQTVLDACAAPGGKTAHMLECMNNIGTMHALDISEKRCEQLKSTLERLNLNADVHTADASLTPNWPVPADGYDRILIDAPCSGLGVIRRHPDIKHHRRPSDIEQLNQIQARLLNNLWPHLAQGGLLLYMTCSVLPSENERQINDFIAQTDNAQIQPIEHSTGLKLEHGVQTLPGVHSMDGFYYSLIKKV